MSLFIRKVERLSVVLFDCQKEGSSMRINGFPQKILFIGTYAGTNYLKELTQQSLYIQLAANQTEEYYIEGLGSHENPVEVISALVTVVFPSTKKIFIKRNREKSDSCIIENVRFINFPVVSIISQTIEIARTVKRWLKKNKEMEDILVLIYGMRIPYLRCVKTIKKFIPDSTVINIVPDLPMYTRMNKQKITTRIITAMNQKATQIMQHKVDGYVLYTEKMKEVLHCRTNSWIVIEGLFNKRKQTELESQNKNSMQKKTILYMGGLEKEYGIDLLIKGFLEAHLPNTELHLYGSGMYLNEILEYSKKYTEIKYLGIVSPTMARVKMQEADLLVNPRPSQGLFTKYSCPSKTLEYMSTGRPAMITKLEGIPEEYFEYVYTIRKETVDGLAADFVKFFNIPESVREKRARQGQQFIYREKDVSVQLNRLIEFAYKIREECSR